jgi:hypothetical protein
MAEIWMRRSRVENAIKKKKKKGAFKWDPAMHEWNCGRLGGFNQYYFAHPLDPF